MTAVALALLTAAALAGCTTASPAPTPTTAITSDAEALAAATKTYAAYLKASDEIFHDGGAGTERIQPYMTPSAYKNASSSFGLLRDRGWHTRGASTFTDFRLEHFTSKTVSAFLCSDVSKVRVLDKKGMDVTPASRSKVLPLQVTFKVDGPSLLLDTSETWA
ncbi:MAG: hypothetical protein ACTHON_14750, partial [Humibacter sp.]